MLDSIRSKAFRNHFVTFEETTGWLKGCLDLNPEQRFNRKSSINHLWDSLRTPIMQPPAPPMMLRAKSSDTK
jgi:hypothetical protein